MTSFRAWMAVAMAAVAVAGGVAVHGLPSEASGGPTTVRIVARQTQAVEVPGAGEGRFLGTRFVASDDLFVNGVRAGRGGRDCEVVAENPDHSARFQCIVTLGLADGIVTLQGLPRLTESGLEPLAVAVTGGTGRYVGASGRAEVRELSPTRIEYIVRVP
jgi:hypothetical protein